MIMLISKFFSMSYVVFATVILASVVQAEEPRNEFGFRANVLLGDGIPANDVLGAGLIGRRYLNDGWFVGGSLDTYVYDFERPAKLVGIRQDPIADVVDADGTTTVVAGFVGREYGDANNGFRWFWSLGLGIAADSVDDVSGPTDNGGTFDLTFDTGNNVQVQGAIGTSWYFSSRWSASFTARLERHFMDIKVTDRISGATSSVDSQTPVGGYLSLNYRF
jgi:hypothetical protein